MLLWHLGGAVLIARYVFRDPRMDLRWLMLGAILPDLIDKPIGSILFHDAFGSHRLFGHALLFPVALLMTVMLVTRRGTVVRTSAIVVVLGVFTHLILDAVWLRPEGFLWPLFGLDFPAISGSAFGELIGDMVRSPLVWLGEAAGATYLGLLWWRHMREPGAIPRFARSGRLPLGS